MPVEIRELVIKATVAQDGNNGSSSSSLTGADANRELINVIVEKVVEIIKEKNAR